jgi:predicted component of type VI protein secretion system
MEQGDLAVSTRQRAVFVLEGVLASVTPTTSRGLFRLKVTGWNVHWYDVPIKRCVTNKNRYPQYGLDVVTFLGQDVADIGAEFLTSINFPHDTIEYHNFRKYTQMLPYQAEIVVIYDSDQDRLERYGQLGRAVVMGQDF